LHIFSDLSQYIDEGLENSVKKQELVKMNSKRADRKQRRAEKQRLEILNWVQELTDKQLVEFFYEAVQGRKISGENDDFRKHFVLAIATSREIKELSSWSSWKLYTLGLADNQSWVDDAIICQHGYCCNHDVISWAKNAICPICEGKVYLT
jgi:hypothetical protein